MSSKAKTKGGEPSVIAEKSDAWTDLGLTLPIFLFYHLGVVFLPVRNAADPVTHELQALAQHSLLMYGALTLAIGVAFVAVLAILGRGHTFKMSRFGVTALEGALYAVLMRTAGSFVVGHLRLAAQVPDASGVFPSLVMALGAGFYEEIAYRVIMFGVGAFLIRKLVGAGPKRVMLIVGWALIESITFSGWHYIGPMGDPFDLQSFVFRAVCGLVLTAIFAFRGFAPAVWTHTLYDVWAMVLS